VTGGFTGDAAEIAFWSNELTGTEWDLLRAGALPESVSPGTLIEAWSLLTASTLTGVNGRVLTAYGDSAVSTGASHPITRASGSTASGATVTVTSSLVAGSASGQAAGTAAGATLTATASFIAGSATGELVGTLNFQAAGMEFGRRTGLGIGTFALDNGASYRYSVHADGLTLGSAILTSTAITLDAAGKLPNLVSASIVPGTTYRVFAIRQSDGEAATFRMVAA
jgi:hypothetical protein